MTRVISVRGRKRHELEADPDFVYCGRAMPRQGWKGSIWGNPFRAGVGGDEAWRNFEAVPPGDWLRRDTVSIPEIMTAEDAVEWFRLYVRGRRSMRDRLPELRGKTLGCWCCNWSPGEPIATPCHAIVLARLADSLID